MTDEGFGAVRPLPGNGLVAHVGGLLLVCDAAEAVVEDLLGALRETAASGGDGRALARRVAQVLAVMMGEPVACAVAGPVSSGVAVLVSGPAFASVTGSGGEVQLAGRDALTWSDRLVPGPVTRVELRLPEAGQAHPFARLDSGVVIGGGVVCAPAEAGAEPRQAWRPEPVAESRAESRAEAVPQAVRQPVAQAEPVPPTPEWSSQPAEAVLPPVSSPVSSPSEWSDPEWSAPAPVSAHPEWSAPPVESAPPAPYPMGPPDHYAASSSAPPTPQPALPQPQAWHSEPVPGLPLQGPAQGHVPPMIQHEDVEPARPGAPGGDSPDVRDQPFEYELLTPGASQGGAEVSAPLPGQADPQPESRPLVYGVDCKNDHFNDPRVPYCAVCGIALVQRTLVPYKGPRPPLGVLLLDDGMTLRLDTDYLVGRDPERAPEVADGSVRPAKVTSPDGSVSRRHLRVALDGWDVNLVDLGSVNGTQIQPPGDPNFYDIPPNEPVAILPGTTVRIGVSRTMRYESHRNR
ncbi:FHA domain-containing protein [Streptosporangium sp. NPDC051023]|uniref:FHA domain-containing protein n=1 Tax=Streptosporangium sp. NPDC051023 TaxID=3155410 RepID=UPI00344E1E10